MTYAKRWILAGAAAALLGGSARAADGAIDWRGDDAAAEPRTVQVMVTDGFQSGFVAAEEGEPVRLVFTRTAGRAPEEVVLPSHGITASLPAHRPVAMTVRSAAGGIGYVVERQAERGIDDAAELSAGNTGGRG
jgi:plastocyanin domain-containing protein